jgi:hypothetical protein
VGKGSKPEAITKTREFNKFGGRGPRFSCELLPGVVDVDPD